MVWKRESLLLSITIPIDIAICTDGKCFLVGVLRRSASVRCHYLFMLVGVYRSRPVQNDVGGSGDCRCYRRNSDTTKTIRYGFVGFLGFLGVKLRTSSVCLKPRLWFFQSLLFWLEGCDTNVLARQEIKPCNVDVIHRSLWIRRLYAACKIHWRDPLTGCY